MSTKKICTIEIGRNGLDNDYTIYEDGTIERYYDRNIYKPNLHDVISVKDLEEHVKEKLLSKAPNELKEKLSRLFYPLNQQFLIEFRLDNILSGVFNYSHFTSLESEGDVEAEFINMYEQAIPQVKNQIHVISIKKLS